MEVAGVDGFPGGWVAVWAQAEARLSVLSVFPVPTFAEVVARTRECAAVGIDIPIGLTDNCARMPDLEARHVLRSPRASSVFPAPVRAAVACTDYREACDASFAAWGKKLSKQTFAITKKIYEANEVMTPELQERIIEVHPEVSFWAMNGGWPMLQPKRSPGGELERTALLSNIFIDDLGALEQPRAAARDDLLDACVAAWSAWRYATRQHGTLPEQPQLDSRGLRMEIVY